MQTRRPLRAFTLIELLTVIAIIAVLAALLFPVFGRIRESARQSTCMSNMAEITRSLKIYYEDNHKYPAALLALVQSNQSFAAPDGSTHNEFYTGGGAGIPLPITRDTYRPLMIGQKYIQDTGKYLCPDDTQIGDPNATLTAVYPQKTPNAGAQVTYTALVAHNIGDNVFDKSLIGNPAYFYKGDSYDTGPQINSTGDGAVPGVTELHYSLDWTGQMGGTDNPNQLKYPNPEADHTVVTWCPYHVTVAHSNMVLVALLNGSVKPVPVNQFLQKGPLGF